MTRHLPEPSAVAAARRGFGSARPAAWAALLVGGALMAAPLALADVEDAKKPTVDSSLVLHEANGSVAFEQPLGIAIDAGHDEIVVANTGLGRVEFFGRDGRPAGYFVHRITGADGVERDGLPKHVAVDAAGRILVTDAWAAYVDICDFRGGSLGRIELPEPDASLDKGGGPGPIAIAPDGRILVASRGKQGRVYVFDPEGHLLSSWGEPGREPGKLSAIAGLAVTPQGEVAVACVLTELGVQVFDAEGKYLRGFGVHDIGPGRFSVPSGIVVTSDSRIWVSDMVRMNVQVFDPEGDLLGILGGGEGLDSMRYPSALASDGKGLLATAETGGKLVRLMWVR